MHCTFIFLEVQMHLLFLEERAWSLRCSSITRLNKNNEIYVIIQKK